MTFNYIILFFSKIIFFVNIRLARYNRSFLLIFNKKNEIRFIGSRFCYWELILIKLSHEAIGQSLLFK